MKKRSTHFLLLLFSLATLSFSQETAGVGLPGSDTYRPCDPSNRPQTCTVENAPVCGYIHDCEGGACTNTFANNCSACAEGSVDGYVVGNCEEIRITLSYEIPTAKKGNGFSRDFFEFFHIYPDPLVQIFRVDNSRPSICHEKGINCPETRPEMCPLIYTATCAVAGDCQGPNCFEDVVNSCVACTQENVAYSLPGACPYNNRGSRTYCEWNNLPGDCTEEYDPVCAHRGNCIGKSCYFTAGNACGACTNANVDYHVARECSEDEETRTFCEEKNRPETCAEEFSPVCAHKADCEGADCYYTAGNACTACVDSAVDWHSEGKCQNENNEGGDDEGRVICNPDNRPDGCDQQAYNAVCAHRPGCEGGICEYTAANHCSACNDIYVNNHTPGEC